MAMTKPLRYKIRHACNDNYPCYGAAWTHKMCSSWQRNKHSTLKIMNSCRESLNVKFYSANKDKPTTVISYILLHATR